jgi:hypothetical protein
MPAKRIAMRKIKDVLRLKHDAKLSHEQIAAGMDWDSAGSLSEAIKGTTH